MKYLQNIWRSLATLLISFVGICLLMFGALKVTPYLFQNGVWAKIGILAVGLEIGGAILYLGVMLIVGLNSLIAQHRKTPKILACLPLCYAIIRYPYWLISVCFAIPGSLGFLQWLIVIIWIIVWVVLLGVSIGALLVPTEESKIQHM